MNGIVIGIDPIIFHLGQFALSWYGLIIALAIAVGILITAREAKHKGVSEDEVHSLVLWAVIAALFGARLFLMW